LALAVVAEKISYSYLRNTTSASPAGQSSIESHSEIRYELFYAKIIKPKERIDLCCFDERTTIVYNCAVATLTNSTGTAATVALWL